MRAGTTWNCGVSPCYPALITGGICLWVCSTRHYSLVVIPPPERPRAWSSWLGEDAIGLRPDLPEPWAVITA